MAFDRTNDGDLDALESEINTDPIGMGYAAAPGTNQMLKLINTPEDNVGGETAVRPFDTAAMMDALEPGDLATGQEATYTQLLADFNVNGADIEPYKAKWRGMFQANSATVTALDAQTASLSRAEVLWGQGTVIVRDDWAAVVNRTIAVVNRT